MYEHDYFRALSISNPYLNNGLYQPHLLEESIINEGCCPFCRLKYQEKYAAEGDAE